METRDPYHWPHFLLLLPADSLKENTGNPPSQTKQALRYDIANDGTNQTDGAARYCFIKRKPAFFLVPPLPSWKHWNRRCSVLDMHVKIKGEQE